MDEYNEQPEVAQTVHPTTHRPPISTAIADGGALRPAVDSPEASPDDDDLAIERMISEGCPNCQGR